MNDLFSKIKHIVKWAKVTKSTDDAGNKPGAIVSYLGQENTATCMLSPYGLFSNVPVDTNVLLFAAYGVEGNRVAISCPLDERIKDLEEGEVAIGNLLAKSFIKLDKEGNIEIVSTKDVTITNAGKLTINNSGDIDIDVNGDINITNANNVNIDASQTNLGVGGQPIARQGDAVQVNTGTGLGTITSGGSNTSI